MRSELQSVLDSLPEMQRENLPELLGELEVIRATALLRMSAPADNSERHDELLMVEAAAERLGVSPDYLYRNSRRLPFTRRMGRNLRFPSLGIDRYIAQNKSK